MTYWKCPECYRERETKDNIVMVVCGVCQIEMKKAPYKFERRVEVNGNIGQERD